MLYVTPCVGVWIETFDKVEMPERYQSHPAWVCGLKHIKVHKLEMPRCHTLRGCVDWNNLTKSLMPKQRRSHPAWVCGLKHWYWIRIRVWPMSHPAWVCGLKLVEASPYRYSICHTLRGCVDWNPYKSFGCSSHSSHPAWVCGLKQNDIEMNTTFEKSHPAWVCGLKHQSIWDRRN